MANRRKNTPTTKKSISVSHPRSCTKDINYEEMASPALSPRMALHEGRTGRPTEPRLTDLNAFKHSSLEEKITIQLQEVTKSIQELKSELSSRINDLEEKLGKELKDLKELIDLQEKKFAAMETSFGRRLDEQDNKILELTRINTNLNFELQRIKKQESEKLSNNILLSGSAIPASFPSENLPQTVTGLIKTHTRYPLKESEIVSAERFGKMPEAGSPDNRGILVKLHRKESKVNIMTHTLATKPSGFFVNEQLTREMIDLYREARKLKKDNPSHIAVLYTRDGIIRAKKTKTGRRYDIFTRAELEKFKQDIGLPVQSSVNMMTVEDS